MGENGNRMELLYNMEADPDEMHSVLNDHPEVAAKLREYAEGMNDVKSLVRQQAIRARNAKLFAAFDNAVGNEKDEMWTDNPPEGRLAPEM